MSDTVKSIETMNITPLPDKVTFGKEKISTVAPPPEKEKEKDQQPSILSEKMNHEIQRVVANKPDRTLKVTARKLLNDISNHPEEVFTKIVNTDIEIKTIEDKANKPDAKIIPEQKLDIAAMLGMDIKPEELIEALIKKGTKREEAINAFMEMQQKIIDQKDIDPKPEPSRVAGAIDIQLALYYQKLYEYSSQSDDEKSVTDLVAIQDNIQNLRQLRTDLGLPRNNYVTETFTQLGLDSFLKEKAHAKAELLKVPDADRPVWEAKYVNDHLNNRAIESFSDYVNTAMKNEDKRKLFVNGYKNRLLSHATKGNPANATEVQKNEAEEKAQEMGQYMEIKGLLDSAQEGGIIALIATLAILIQLGQEAYKMEVQNKQAA